MNSLGELPKWARVELDSLHREIERLRTENWQLRGALGYAVPASILPGDFQCGLCGPKARRIAELTEAVRLSLENVRTLRAAYGGGIAISIHGGEVWERLLTEALP